MIQAIRQFADRDGHVLHHPDDIGELQADELDALLLHKSANVFGAVWHRCS
jgi:hypothetical protein